MESKPQRRVLKAAGMMSLAVFFIAVMNACAKLASAHHGIVEIVFYRGLVSLVLLSGWIVATRRFALLKTRRPLAHLGRSSVGTVGVSCIFWAYSLMPMADVSVLLLTSSLFVTVLSVPLLGETVGKWRWGAVAVGFIGAAIVGNPTTSHFTLYGFSVAIFAAFMVSLVFIFLAKLGKTESAITTVYYFSLVSTLVSGVYMIFAGNWPDARAYLPLFGTGIASMLSLLLKAEAYRHAEASFLSPLDYMNLLWSILLGYMIWQDVPGTSMMAGAALIIGSNVAILWREHVHRKRHLDSPLVN
jgi:drug/metabolite transporter (DMT)-like permease